jgi:protein ImuA
LDNGIPGVGFPCWNVELLKVRNGRPGTWQVEWRGGRFTHLSMLTAIHSHQQKKTG